MCGIAGYIGKENGVEYVYSALKRLEYRGYDSAGIAVLKDGKSTVAKAKGKLINLEAELSTLPAANIAIGHTRWATHGPATKKCSPHKSGGHSTMELLKTTQSRMKNSQPTVQNFYPIQILKLLLI